MPKILSLSTYLFRKARYEQHAKIVYFYTGTILPPFPHTYHLAASSTSITPRTLFTVFQKAHQQRKPA